AAEMERCGPELGLTLRSAQVSITPPGECGGGPTPLHLGSSRAAAERAPAAQLPMATTLQPAPPAVADRPDSATPTTGTDQPERWTLSRAGIINVYQYGNETLQFAGGRLLLRGVNGSGKSTAMN